MNPSGDDMKLPEPGPECCRETAATRIKHEIERHKYEIAGLEALLKVAERAEPGSTLEEFIWSRLTR